MPFDLKPRPQRPLLLLDIDGVLAVLGPGSGEATFESIAGAFPVTITVAARKRLSRLANAFQIVWASSWMRDGAEAFGPLVGLPADLPFLRFDPDVDRDAATYKLPVVERFARNRPVAWVDDELGEDVAAWADSRQHPTLLVQPDPRIGLVDDHVVALLAFAARVGSSAGAVDEA